jgi:uncharacterized repeat protein (TIGR01451 family)
MTTNEIPEFTIKGHSRLRRVGASTMALMIFVSQVSPALANIDNSATVSGTYGVSTTTYGPSTATVPVVLANGAMTVVKTAGAPTLSVGDITIVDAGDTIAYSYAVKNTGNVTLTNVAPTDPGPTFNGFAGTGSLGAFSPAGPITLAPGVTQNFTATYTLTALDTYHAASLTGAVSNTASATGKKPDGTSITPLLSSTATTTIPAGPKLTVTKVAVLDDTNGTVALKAEAGEFIDYTYTVYNAGNVPMTNIKINDTHEAVLLPAGTVANEVLTIPGPIAGSVDSTANDGIWTTLQPGATIRFTYHHLVTQAEVDAG